MLLSFAIKRSVGQFFQQGVGFAIENTIILLDNSVPDGLPDMAFAASRRPHNMMHITLRWRRFTTVGIRFMASLFEYGGG